MEALIFHKWWVSVANYFSFQCLFVVFKTFIVCFTYSCIVIKGRCLLAALSATSLPLISTCPVAKHMLIFLWARTGIVFLYISYNWMFRLKRFNCSQNTASLNIMYTSDKVPVVLKKQNQMAPSLAEYTELYERESSVDNFIHKYHCKTYTSVTFETICIYRNVAVCMHFQT